MAVVGMTRDFVTSYEAFQRKTFAQCAAMAGSLAWLVLLLNPEFLLGSTPARILGRVLDVRGAPVPNAHLSLRSPSGTLLSETFTDSEGTFRFNGLSSGNYRLTAESTAFTPVTIDVPVVDGQQEELTLQFGQLAAVNQSVTVFASSSSALAPDSSEEVVVHDQVLDANPGRPGAPISIPGLPIETASGDIKAAQYFAPGVAGDHGEPVAQFFRIGDFIYPNNLPANAHGNGYSDPKSAVLQLDGNVCLVSRFRIQPARTSCSGS